MVCLGLPEVAQVTCSPGDLFSMGLEPGQVAGRRLCFPWLYLSAGVDSDPCSDTQGMPSGPCLARQGPRWAQTSRAVGLEAFSPGWAAWQGAWHVSDPWLCGHEPEGSQSPGSGQVAEREPPVPCRKLEHGIWRKTWGLGLRSREAGGWEREARGTRSGCTGSQWARVPGLLLMLGLSGAG